MRVHYKEIRKNILEVVPDKRKEIINWGKDNAYPNLVDALIGMSVTAKTCVDKVEAALYGGGFVGGGDFIVNSRGQTLNDVYSEACRELAKHNNTFIQTGFNGEFKFDKLLTSPCSDSRYGKQDDLNYSGKMVVYDNWDGTRGKNVMKSAFTLVDVYNPPGS